MGTFDEGSDGAWYPLRLIRPAWSSLGHSLTYAVSPEADQATSCVLPNKEGPGVMLETGSFSAS